jgi:uncharacterized protein
VKALREYIINFGRLKPGKHEFEFTIDEEFYKHFEYSLVKTGKVNLLLTIEKQSESLLIVNFAFKGYIDLECDRCLDEFKYPVDSEKKLFIKLDQDVNENDDELIMLEPDSYELDISPYIYEFINLELPLHKSCDQGRKDCNPEMLKYLGHVNDKEEKEEDIDPRWADLKKIKDENEE